MPKIVIVMDGGLVQTVLTDAPENMRVAVVDYDVEGTDEEELTKIGNEWADVRERDYEYEENEQTIMNQVFAYLDAEIDASDVSFDDPNHFYADSGCVCRDCEFSGQVIDFAVMEDADAKTE